MAATRAMAAAAAEPEYKSITYELLDELGEEHTLGCKCCRFNKGIDLPIPRDLTIKETTRYAREFSASIFKNWTQLNAILKRFESTIQKRWMKKSLKQRREVLLRAWPNMPTTHRPDYEHFRTNKQVPRSRTCRTQAFLWPYINLEDLQQRHLLLLFLNSRGRNMPNTFITADVKAAHLGDKWVVDIDFDDFNPREYCSEEQFIEDHLGRYCLMFDKYYSPRGYGRMRDRVREPIKAGQLKYASYNPPGLLSLELQAGIYSFLLGCAKIILHDIEPCQFVLAPSQPEPIMARAGNIDQSSLTAHSQESPYRVPQKPDLDRMRMMVNSRLASAEDHVWLLHEDPGYFMDCLNEWIEHNESHHCRQKQCGNCYTWETGGMISDAYLAFCFWSDISTRLIEMPSIEKQMSRANHTKLRLAVQDENKWAALTEVLFQMRAQPMKLLYDGLPLSPRLRGRYKWFEDTKQWILKGRSPQPMQRIDRLFYTLLQKKEDSENVHSWSSLVEEVQYMLETDSEASQYIDSWVANQFSDLALMAELTKAVDSLAPWFNEEKGYSLSLGRQSVDNLVDRTRSVTGRLIISLPSAAKDAMSVGLDLSKKGALEYPADKRPSKANIEKMREAEWQLDLFWSALDDAVKEKTKLSLKKVFENRQTHPHDLYRTPAWVEPKQLPTPDATPQRTVLAEIDHNIRRSSTDSPTRVKVDVKEKIKTRGTPAAADPRSATYRGPLEVDPPSEAQEQQNKAKISKKAYRVFCALLPGKDVLQQRCELPWDELIAGFDAIGLEPEKLYGSVWIFKPRPKGEGLLVKAERSIQFHEPKEVRHGQKVPKAMVRAFGRRLKHAYGWECAEDMFECE